MVRRMRARFELARSRIQLLPLAQVIHFDCFGKLSFRVGAQKGIRRIMKRVLVCGAGGSPATNFVRSLRRMAEPLRLIGVDCDPFTLERAETDLRVLVPRADDPAYLPVLNEIIAEQHVEFVHAQNDIELEFLSAHRDRLKAKVFLPPHGTVEICVDKFRSYQIWKEAGIAVPQTRLLHTAKDLRAAMKDLGPRVWLRNIKGAAGAGSYPTDSFDEAREWIEFQKGWGHFTAAQCLTSETVTWMSLWSRGELIVAQGRKRLSWELGNRAPSGVTGVTGTGMTFAHPQLDQIAMKTIRAVDAKPDGIFSVDCTYDAAGVPNPTEINIGRFFTTHLFFTEAGLNMPELFVRLAFGEPLPPIPVRFNPLPNNLLWVRGVDFLPRLTTLASVERSRRELDERRAMLT